MKECPQIIMAPQKLERVHLCSEMTNQIQCLKIQCRIGNLLGKTKHMTALVNKPPHRTLKESLHQQIEHEMTVTHPKRGVTHKHRMQMNRRRTQVRTPQSGVSLSLRYLEDRNWFWSVYAWPIFSPTSVFHCWPLSFQRKWVLLHWYLPKTKLGIYEPHHAKSALSVAVT